MRILGDGGSRTGVRTPQETKLQEAGSRVTGNDTLGEQIESLTLLVVDLEWRKIALVANAGRESPLPQLVPDAPAGAVLTQVALLDQRPEMLLERVAIAAGQSNRITHRDASMLACELDDP
ncbi:MAG: hypothetical protein AW09_002791 [Candidatus Accumulibacter phosphatis]|uniref:Uncharacterized protein n=1 Tax=Candidatus Accumulibacter phosphatis TaxID=327160 RepID=A0A080LU46_9PROT|nr:MAG: hypothetical protein AW09_002791 [Candidatus Accumulibacter phosphatis]